MFNKNFDQQIDKLVKDIGSRLETTMTTAVTAESCTGGMVAEALTSIAGSSAWFDRAFVTYSYEAKQQMLGVSADTLTQEGAVSEACVREMVQGALQQSQSSVSNKLAVAISGIAGPDGALPDKPVGTVWIAWSWKKVQTTETFTTCTCFHFEGDRTAVRQQSTIMALKGIINLLVKFGEDNE